MPVDAQPDAGPRRRRCRAGGHGTRRGAARGGRTVRARVRRWRPRRRAARSAGPRDRVSRGSDRAADGRLVGHCSGATTLDVLAPHERFGLHPLMTFSRRGGRRPAFAGASAAVAGSSERALDGEGTRRAARHGAVRDPRRPPRRVSRGRVDLVELPRHGRGRGRGAARRRRARPPDPAPAHPGHRRELGRRGAGGAHRAGRTGRHSDRRAPAGGDRRARTRAAGAVRRARRTHADDQSAPGRRPADRPAVHQAARAAT